MGAEQSSDKGDGWDGWAASWTPCLDPEESAEKLQSQRAASLALASSPAEVSAARDGGEVSRGGTESKICHTKVTFLDQHHSL